MKCHGDKGRLSPSQCRRISYIRAVARAARGRRRCIAPSGVVAVRRGAAQRGPSCVRAARPRFPRGKASFPARLIPGEIAPSLRPALYINYRLHRLTFEWENERNEDEVRISTSEMCEWQSCSSIKSECTRSTVIEDRPLRRVPSNPATPRLSSARLT